MSIRFDVTARCVKEQMTERTMAYRRKHVSGKWGASGGFGKFCYLGDMLNGGGGADFASVVREHCAWRKSKELSGILTRKEVSLKLKGKVYQYVTHVRSAMM